VGPPDVARARAREAGEVTAIRPTARPRRHRGRRELGTFAAAYLTYFGVRAITQGSVPRAVSDALDVMRLERRLGIAVEKPVQALVAGSRTLIDLADGLYIWGHWPLLIVGGALAVCVALAVVTRHERRRAATPHPSQATPRKGTSCPPRPHPARPVIGSRSRSPEAAPRAAVRSSR
jgi:hypothetical protein